MISLKIISKSLLTAHTPIRRRMRTCLNKKHIDNNYGPHPPSVKGGPKAIIGNVNFTILNELFQ
jgi:hypothetical protein